MAAHPARATRLPQSSKKSRKTGKIGTIEGLAGLSLDALTSVAYGPEAIHRMPLNQRATILASVLRRHSTEVAQAMLRHLGFTVDVVSDGAAAVAAAVSTRYRAIMMAYELPVTDGYDATAQIRGREESRIPIIAITGAGPEQGRHQWTAAGMDDHVSKPVSVAALAGVLARSAHTLSGSSANLGATDLARLCATLSMPSAAADPTYSKTLFDCIEAELARVRSVLGLLVAPA